MQPYSRLYADFFRVKKTKIDYGIGKMNFDEAKHIFIGAAAGELSEAVVVIENEADGGSGVAAYYLAEAYAFGRGVIRNEKKAFEIAKITAEIFPPAKAVLAYDYFCGRGIDKNIEKGLSLFREAANCGCVIADMFLSNNSECKNYALEQFSAYISRQEKISRLKSINDDMARSMLYVYAANEQSRNEQVCKFADSVYRYAKATYLGNLALSQKIGREKMVSEITDMAVNGYVYAYDLLGDLYRTFGAEVPAADCYVKAFCLGIVASGTKFLLSVQSNEEIGDNLIDEFIAAAYKFSREGYAYASFLLAYYYGAMIGYDSVASELLKTAAYNGSSLAERIIKLKNLKL